MGLDLAGIPQNPSGVALLRGKLLRTMLVREDLEVEELCRREGVRLVAVDAPLSLPVRGSLRPSDLALLRMGFRVFPPTFSGMRSLTLRGISLSRKLRGEGVRVIEVHPRTSGRILFGTPNRMEWARLLARRGWRVKGGTGNHELDACVSALTGLLHLKGRTLEVGKGRGRISIPSVSWIPSP
jgi:predicted nuclease with RNAse H fold